MIVNSIEKMEKIVKSYPNFEWDNWTVIIYTDDDGYYTKYGIFKDNKWMTKYKFEMIDHGVWNIPDRFLAYVQV